MVCDGNDERWLPISFRRGFTNRFNTLTLESNIFFVTLASIVSTTYMNLLHLFRTVHSVMFLRPFPCGFPCSFRWVACSLSSLSDVTMVWTVWRSLIVFARILTYTSTALLCGQVSNTSCSGLHNVFAPLDEVVFKSRMHLCFAFCLFLVCLSRQPFLAELFFCSAILLDVFSNGVRSV